MNDSACNSEGSELENLDSSKRNYTAFEAAQRAKRYDTIVQLWCLNSETIEKAMSLCRQRKCTDVEKRALHHFRFSKQRLLKQLTLHGLSPEAEQTLVQKELSQLAEAPIVYPLHTEFGLLVIELGVLTKKEAVANYKERRRLREAQVTTRLKRAVKLYLQDIARVNRVAE